MRERVWVSDEKADEEARAEENCSEDLCSKGPLEEDREGQRACENGPEEERPSYGREEEGQQASGDFGSGDDERLRSAPPGHRRGRSASAEVTRLRRSRPCRVTSDGQTEAGSALRTTPSHGPLGVCRVDPAATFGLPVSPLPGPTGSTLRAEPGSHRLPRPSQGRGGSGRSTMRSWVRIVLRNHRSLSSSRPRGKAEKGLSLGSLSCSPDARSASDRPSRFPRPRSVV